MFLIFHYFSIWRLANVFVPLLLDRHPRVCDLMHPMKLSLYCAHYKLCGRLQVPLSQLDCSRTSPTIRYLNELSKL